MGVGVGEVAKAWITAALLNPLLSTPYLLTEDAGASAGNHTVLYIHLSILYLAENWKLSSEMGLCYIFQTLMLC